MREDYVVMGKVVGSFGINGWLKIKSFSEKIEALGKYENWYFSQDEKIWSEKKIEQFKINLNKISVKIYGINDRTAADGCKGYLIGIPRQSLPKLANNEFYWNDLIGFEVVTLSNVLLGKLETFIETGANDVMVVEGDKQRLLPYTPSVVKKVDVKQQQIIVDWDENF
ncbi:MAG: ribosome maturation factor RimM [Methylophilaceae bacterium]